MSQSATPHADAIRQTRALRDTLLADPYRPTYHFVSPEGRCAPFDPNGALFYNGRYHLMVIVQTDAGHCWGHVSSTDLVHWRQHPIALQPGGADNCIFSGGAFIDAVGVPTISYWGVDYSNQQLVGICLATSTDPNLDVWTKSPHNPVIRETAIGLTELPDGTVHGTADPSAIWRHNDRYYLLTGNLLVLRKYGLDQNLEQHQGDTAYLFVSDDLVTWHYLHPFYTSRREWTAADEDDMCPDFFPLGHDRHMLLFISHNHGCQYYIGHYHDDHFFPETHGRMTWVDNAFFAPESLLDDRGRRIMWAWIMEQRDRTLTDAAGWSGTLSLPRQLSLAADHTLRMTPVEELARLRYNPRSLPPLNLAADTAYTLPGIRGNTLELDLVLNSDAPQFGLTVCATPDGAEQTVITCDRAAGTLTIDTRQSTLGDGPKSLETAPFVLAPGEPLHLRVFLDRSLVEVFANDRQAVTRRLYPTRPDALDIALFTRGGPTHCSHLNAWEMAPANPW